MVTIEGQNGYMVLTGNNLSNTKHDCFYNSGNDSCEATDEMKVFQARAGTDLYRPVYATKKAVKNELYLLTQEDILPLTLVTPGELNFWDYPVDVGRFRMAITSPHECG